jgi:hypothetical protein
MRLLRMLTGTRILASAAPLARYAFQRCLPTEHRMHFAAQRAPIVEVWRIGCETIQRL